MAARPFHVGAARLAVDLPAAVLTVHDVRVGESHPSDVADQSATANYPFAQELWHLQALNTLLMQTSTLEGNSMFYQALNGTTVLSGLGFA